MVVKVDETARGNVIGEIGGGSVHPARRQFDHGGIMAMLAGEAKAGRSACTARRESVTAIRRIGMRGWVAAVLVGVACVSACRGRARPTYEYLPTETYTSTDVDPAPRRVPRGGPPASSPEPSPPAAASVPADPVWPESATARPDDPMPPAADARVPGDDPGGLAAPAPPPSEAAPVAPDAVPPAPDAAPPEPRRWYDAKPW
jgi:hypothetical protein